MKRSILSLAYKLYSFWLRIRKPLMLGVRILLIKNNRVLLVYHTYQPYWFFPGGAVKLGETLVEAAMREAHEEVGAVMDTPPQLLGLYTNFYEGKSDHIAVFVTEEFTLDERLDRWEIERMQFFALDALPESLSPGSYRRVQDYLNAKDAQTQHPYVKLW